MTPRQFDIFIRMLNAIRLELTELNHRQGVVHGEGATGKDIRPPDREAEIALDLLDMLTS